MAGAGAGALISESASVLVLEAEERPGYHTTGRSAATFIENYGAPSVRDMNRASRDFLCTPPADFSDGPIVSPRGLLYVAASDELAELDEEMRGAEGMQRLSRDEAVAIYPPLARGATVAAGFEPGAMDIDVDRLHQGFLRLLRKRGGTLACDQRVSSIQRTDGVWHVSAGDKTFTAPTLVNAAGAWGDHVAQLAGVVPLGLQPLRRSVAIVELQETDVVQPDWPLVAGAAGGWYCKPEHQWLLISPADETPSEPCDAYPEELDLATGIDRAQSMCGWAVKRIRHSWAGLRTFAPDHQLVNGFAADVDGFYWLVGQGGYGIQTAPGMSMLCAANILGADLPSSFARADVNLKAVTPERFST
jgi:D-arginine dehydrogenase